MKFPKIGIAKAYAATAASAAGASSASASSASMALAFPLFRSCVKSSCSGISYFSRSKKISRPSPRRIRHFTDETASSMDSLTSDIVRFSVPIPIVTV